MKRSAVTAVAIALAGCSVGVHKAPLAAPGLSIVAKPVENDGQISRYVEYIIISAAALQSDEGVEHDFRLDVLVSDKGRDEVETVRINFADGRSFELPKQARTTLTEGREHEAFYGLHDEIDGFAWSYIDVDTDDIAGYLAGDIILELHHLSGIASLGVKLVDDNGSEHPVSFPAAPELEETIPTTLAGEELTLQIVPLVYDAHIFLGREDPSNGNLIDEIEATIPAGKSTHILSGLNEGVWGGDIMVAHEAEAEIEGVEIAAQIASGMTIDFEAEQ